MDFCSWEPPGLLPELGELRPGNVSVAVPPGVACNTLLQLGSDVKGELSAVYMHTFLFQWQPGVSAAMQERAAKEIRALQGQIPGLLETSYNKNISPRSQGFTHGGVMKFRDAAALEAYSTHPVHQKLVDWLMPLLKVAAELDYEM